MSSFMEKKNLSSKTAQIQSQTNHFEEVSIHGSFLISPQSFSRCQEGFQLLSSSLTALPSFLWNLPSHFTSQQLSPTALVKLKGSPHPFPFPTDGSRQSPASPTAPVAWTMPAPCPAEACWPFLLTSNSVGINFSSKHQYRVHLETPTLCKKQLVCYLLSSPSIVVLWPLW